MKAKFDKLVTNKIVENIAPKLEIVLVTTLFAVVAVLCIIFVSTLTAGLPKVFDTSLFLNRNQESYGYQKNDLLFVKSPTSQDKYASNMVVIFKENRSFGIGVFDSFFVKDDRTYAVIEENTYSLSVKVLPISNLSGIVVGDSNFLGTIFSVFGEFRFFIIPCASSLIIFEIIKMIKELSTKQKFVAKRLD